MKEINLKMIGPIDLIGEKNIFNIPETKSPGIYFFTFKIGDEYLIEYIGITTRSFNSRFLEHLQELLSGGYQFYDLQKMRDEKDFVVFKGRYGKETDDISKFLSNYEYYSGLLKEQMQELKIFLMPLDKEKRILERIEGKLYQILRDKKDKRVMKFIKGVRSSPKRDNERPMNVTIEPNLLASQIPSSFEV